ncbi:MAG: hypothetical protein ABI822_14595 [Bryobacteraceae bacterium]
MKFALCAVLLPGLLSAQAALETGILTGATATAAGRGAKGTAKALTGVFGAVQKTAAQAAGGPVSKQAQPAIAAVEKPVEAVKLPDVAQISTGMTRDELLAKFGTPSQKMTIPEGSHLTERYRYDVGKDSVRIILEDGKVKEAIASTASASPLEKF